MEIAMDNMAMGWDGSRWTAWRCIGMELAMDIRAMDEMENMNRDGQHSDGSGF
jgi:hypothetical protein